jgi:hypothetical protein
MSVGQQISNSVIDSQLTQLSVALRDVLQKIDNFNTEINGQGDGLTYLQSIGYDAADAQTVLTLLGYLNTISGVYYGSATQAADFNFNNALSVLWAGSF